MKLPLITSSFLIAYSDFTFRRVKQDFGLTTVEGGRFLPEIEPIEPSNVATVVETFRWNVFTL